MSDSQPPGRIGARVSWGVSDQALSSLTNFLLGVLVARSVSASAFGAFGLGYSIFIFAVGVSRSLTSDPLLVRHSGEDHQHWRDATAAVTGVGLLLGMVGGMALLAGGLTFGGSDRSMFVAFACSLPGLLWQDGWRYSFVADGRSRLAFNNDLLFLLLMIPAFSLLIGTGNGSVGNLVLAWGGAATVAAASASLRERIRPDLRRTASWLRQEGDLAFRYAAEFVAGNGALQVTLILIAALAGLMAVGSLRAGFILFGPVLVILASGLLVLVPEGIRILHRGRGALRRAIRLLAAGLALISALWGGVIAVLPDGVGEGLLGRTWPGARELLLPLTVMFAASAAETAFIIGLRSLAAARQSLLARLIEVALTIIGGTVGAALAGAQGAAWGLAAAYWLEVAVWRWQFLAALGGSQPQPDKEDRDEPTLPSDIPE
jgi:O-antigen/teichoic acid export membrane protein